MQRIMIVGCPGAGKTALAVGLGRVTGLPVYHLDQMFWRPGYTPVPRDARTAAIETVLASQAYILEGGYPDSYPVRLADCDTLIWLDFGLCRRLVRVLCRLVVASGARRLDRAEGCPDGLGPKAAMFWRRFWLGHHPAQAILANLVASLPAGTRFHRLRTPADVRSFLNGVHK